MITRRCSPGCVTGKRRRPLRGSRRRRARAACKLAARATSTSPCRRPPSLRRRHLISRANPPYVPCDARLRRCGRRSCRNLCSRARLSLSPRLSVSFCFFLFLSVSFCFFLLGSLSSFFMRRIAVTRVVRVPAKPPPSPAVAVGCGTAAAWPPLDQFITRSLPCRPPRRCTTGLPTARSPPPRSKHGSVSIETSKYGSVLIETSWAF